MNSDGIHLTIVTFYNKYMPQPHEGCAGEAQRAEAIAEPEAARPFDGDRKFTDATIA
jgi:hypothetical protein